MNWNLHPRRVILGLTLPFAMALAACGDDPAEPGHDEELPAEMHLTIGGQTVTVTEFGTQTPNPVLLPPGTHQVTVQFLDDEEQVMAIDADEYRLEINSDAPAVASYQGSGAFTGTLTTAAGSTAIRPQLFHIEEGHADFGPFPVNVTIQ